MHPHLIYLSLVAGLSDLLQVYIGRKREIKKRAETNMSRDRDKDRKTDGGKDHLII